MCTYTHTYIYIYIYIYNAQHVYVSQIFLFLFYLMSSYTNHLIWATDDWIKFLDFMKYCYIFTFDPAKNAIPRWCPGRRWHILMSVMRGNHVGGNWLMKWDELKKFLWYTHWLMHWKKVTCELHDSYFRLMTIKHAISKIEWAIEWPLNYYIAQSRRKSRQLSSSCSWVQVAVELETEIDETW